MKSTQSYLQIKCSFSWNTYERKLVLCIQWSCIVVISISSRLHTEFQLHHKEKTLNINIIALYVQTSRENCARYLATGSWPLADFCFLCNGNDSSTGFEGRGGGEADISKVLQPWKYMINTYIFRFLVKKWLFRWESKRSINLIYIFKLATFLETGVYIFLSMYIHIYIYMYIYKYVCILWLKKVTLPRNR